jgi:hypothetical protein
MQVVGNKTLGLVAGLIFAILVSISVLGVLNIDMYTGGILTETAARHGYMPGFLARSSDDGRLHHIDARTHQGTHSTSEGRWEGVLRRYLGLHVTKTPM